MASKSQKTLNKEAILNTIISGKAVENNNNSMERLQHIKDSFASESRIKNDQKIMDVIQSGKIQPSNNDNAARIQHIKDSLASNNRGNTKNVPSYNSQADVQNQLADMNKNGNVDLLNRPVINTKRLEEAGWGKQEDGIATVYSSSYSNKDGTKTVLLTPILQNGTVLSPDELDREAGDILDGKADKNNILIGTFTGADSIQQAGAYGEKLHNLHASYYGNSDSQKSFKTNSLFGKMGETSFENNPQYQKIKTDYQEKTASEFKGKYGIDMSEFDDEQMKKYAKAHDLKYGMNMQSGESVPYITYANGKSIAKDTELRDEAYSLYELARYNESRKELKKGTNAVDAASHNYINSLSFGMIDSNADKLDKMQDITSNKKYTNALPDKDKVQSSDFVSKYKEEHPIASAVGEGAGELTKMIALKGAISKATGSVKWLASKPEWLTSAINDGLTFATLNAANTAGAGGNAKEVAKKAGIGAVGGVSGSLASSVVGAFGENLLFKAGLQNKIIPEIARNGVAAASFSLADSASTYFLHPKEERPTAGEIAQNAAVAFAFASITTAVNVGKIKADSKQTLNELNDGMTKSYDEMLRAATDNNAVDVKKFAQEVVDYTDAMENYLNGKGVEILDNNAASGTVERYITESGKNVKSKTGDNKVLKKARFVGEDKRVKGILEDLQSIRSMSQEYLTKADTIKGEAKVYDTPLEIKGGVATEPIKNDTTISNNTSQSNAAEKAEKGVNTADNAGNMTEVSSNTDNQKRFSPFLVARNIIKQNNSSLKASEISGVIKEMQNILTDGAINESKLNTAWAMASKVGNLVAETSKETYSDMYDTYKDLRDKIRNTPVSISNADKADIGGVDSFNEFRKNNFGGMRISDNGIPIDSFYQELSEMYPNFFDAQKETHPAEQLMKIQNVLQEIKPVERNVSSEEKEALSESISLQVYNECINNLPLKFLDDSNDVSDKDISVPKTEALTASIAETMNKTIKGVPADTSHMQETNEMFQSEKDVLFDKEFVSRYADDFVSGMANKNSILYQQLSASTGSLADELTNYTLTGQSVLSGNNGFELTANAFKAVLIDAVNKNAVLHNNAYGSNDVLNAQVNDIRNGDFSVMNIAPKTEQNQTTPIAEPTAVNQSVEAVSMPLQNEQNTETIDTTASVNSPYTIKKDIDTRDNSDIWVVKPKELLSKEDFAALRTEMKNKGGYYSKYKGGFLFRQDPAELLKSSNDTVDAKEYTPAEQTKQPDNTVSETNGNNLTQKSETNTEKPIEKVVQSDIIENKERADGKSQQVADFVKDKLQNGEKITSDMLFKAAGEVYGGTLADNTFTVKDAYDAMELGVNQYILSLEGKITPERMDSIIEKLPTQTKRTEGMDKYQQFSTPPTIAYYANYAANVNSNDTMLEPSAGIGGIAVFAKKDGAKVIVNELDKRRLSVLKNMPFDAFYNENAEQINNILGGEIEPTVVVMNPPFSSSSERNIKSAKIGAKHIEEALKMLAPNGRLVAITGKSMADDAAAFRDWWKDIKSKYNVVANIGISGKNYNKYGTNFGIQMLIIDKNGATKNTQTGYVENISDLQEILGGIRDGRPTITGTGSSASGKLVRQDNKGENGSLSGKTEKSPRSRRAEDTEIQQAEATPARKETSDRGEVLSKSDNAISDTGNRAVDGKRKVASRDTGKSELSNVLESNSDDRRTSPNEQSKSDVLSDTRSDIHSGTTAEDENAGGTVVRSARKSNVRNRLKKKELTDSIFEQYQTQPLKLKDVKQHPAKISESAAMSAISPPKVTYKPSIPDNIVKNGILSDVQLEAVTYAGQSHNQTLPNGETRGFFIGDGTGVGKGRTLTGIILDNYMQGRKKSIWVTLNSSLFNDMKRDVKALFGNSDLVHSFKGGKDAEKSLNFNDGILAVSYDTLSSGWDNKGSNFEKIIDWFGKDFDGVIVFDEAHKMANSGKKGTRGRIKPSQAALSGIEIQKRLPKARVVYSSATGATEVENLRYAERLGLWGEGTAFLNSEDFVNKIKAGGLAAMELIARDMKAQGVYLSRNISYDDVKYDRITHKLTAPQRKIYDELAKSWQIVFQNMNEALKTTNQISDGKAKQRAVGGFWGSQQRFFNQILTSMQVPSVIKDMEKLLADGNSCVVQLVSTNEAADKKEFARLKEAGLDLEDFDTTPKQMLMDYIEHCFPVQQYEEYRDDDGNKRSRPVFDSKGKPVINREAAKQKEELLDKLGSIKVPSSPIDMIIDHFGADMVAENTGRSRRVEEKNGKRVEVKLSGKKDADVDAFQSGKKRIIIFSKAGGTGKSYHADLSAKNQQHRVHYLLEPGWRADDAVQGFGRSHRSNQASSPTFKLVTTDLKGQMRFVSTIAKRLDQLGALTKGQRQAGGQGMFSASDNLENSFAQDVLAVFYKDLINNRVDGISDGVKIVEKLGLKDKILDEYGAIKASAQELREVNKFLNRILCLDSNEQNTVFEGYSVRLEEATESAAQAGTLDRGLENYKADKISVNESKDIRIDKSTGAATKYYNLTAKNKVKPVQLSELPTDSKDFLGYYQNNNTGAVRAVFKSTSRTDQYGNVTANVKLYTQIQQKNGRPKCEYQPSTRLYANWKKISDTAEAEKLWSEAIDKLPEYTTENIHLIGGVVLPVWDKLPTENVRIYRVLTDEGDMLIGRVIPENLIDGTLRRMGASRKKEEINTLDLIQRIKQGDKVHLDNGWTIKQSRVSGEQRIEIVGPSYEHTDILKNKGVFTERITYATRYFIPANTGTEKVIDGLLNISPVERVENSNVNYSKDSDSGVMWGTSKKGGAGIEKYTPSESEKITKDAKTYRNLVVDKDISLHDFFNNRSRNNTGNKFEKLYLGKVSDSLALRINGVLKENDVIEDVRGEHFIVTNDLFSHVNKKHGVKSTETAEQVTADNIDRLLDVINQPSDVTFGGFDENGNPKILFKKDFDGANAIYVQFNSTNRNGLFGKSFYYDKKIKKEDTLAHDGDKTSALYAQNDQSQSSNNSISQLNEKSNIKSDNFKQWFGDWENDPENASKVVNEDGTPKVVYHGTKNTEFTVFDRSKSEKRVMLNVFGEGNYFTSDIDRAEQYAGENGRVIKAYINIKNPYYPHTRGGGFLREICENFGLNYGKAIHDSKGTRSIIQGLLKKHGYDGIIVLENIADGEPETVIAFDSNQIKSATDNIGTFDRNNADIRYSLKSRKDNTKDWNGKPSKDSSTKPLHEIVSYLSDTFGVPISTGNLNYNKAQGEYKNFENSIRVKITNDLPNITHELGHLLDKKYDLKGMSNIDEALDFAERNHPTLMQLYKDKDKLNEAVAEFVREYLKNPNNAEKETPNFYKEFTAALDEQDTAALEQASKYIQDYFNSDFRKKVNAATITNREIKKAEKGNASDRAKQLYTKIVDDFAPINDVMKYVNKTSGLEHKGSNDAYTMAINSRNADAITSFILKVGMADSNGNMTEGKSFIDCIEKISPKNIKDFDNYLILKHSIEWLEPKDGEVKRVFADDSLQDVERIKEEISAYEQEHPEYKTAAENLYEYQRNMLKMWVVDTGGMSEDLYKELQEKYPNYVPFRRYIGKNKTGVKSTFANQHTPISKAKGSGASIISPLESIMQNTSRFVKFGMRNKVMGTLVNYADNVEGFAQFMEEVPPDKIRHSIGIIPQVEKLKDIMSDLDEPDFLELSDALDNIFGDSVTSYTPVAKEGKQIVTYMDGGKYRYFQVHDKPLYDAIANMTPRQLDGLNKLGKMLNATNVLITQFNYLFGIKNPIRDFDTALKHSKAYDNPAKFAAAYATSLWHIIRNSKEYKEYQAAGGGHMSNFSDSIDAVQKVLHDVAAKDMNKARRLAYSIFRHPIEALTRWNEITETIPRLAEFEGMKKKGADNQEAAYEAADVTVNFNRSGSAGRAINKVFRFSNAQVQGVDKEARTFTTGGKNNILKYIMRYVLSAVLTSALIEFWNRLIDKDGWDELSQYQKNNFYCIAYGDGKFIKLPKAREAAIPNTLIERSIDLAFGDKDAFYQFGEYIGDTILPSWLPLTGIISGTIEGGLEEGAEEALHQAAGSTMFGGIVDNMVNEDFKGTPIVSSSLEDTPKKQQTNNKTTWLAYAIGQLTNTSPLKADHIIDSYAGILGKLNRAFDTMDSSQIDPTAGLKSTFTADSVYSTDAFNKVYEHRDKQKEKFLNNSTPQNACLYEKYASTASYITKSNRIIKSLPAEEQREARQKLIDDVKNMDMSVSDTDKSIAKSFGGDVDDSYCITTMPKEEISYTKNGKNYSYTLTYDEYRDYVNDYMEEVKKQREKVVSKSKYLSASDNEKIDMLKEANTEAAKNVKEDYKKKLKSKFQKNDE